MEELSKIPSREELIAKLVGSFKARYPICIFAGRLQRKDEGEVVEQDA